MRAHFISSHVDSSHAKDLDALVEMSEGPKPRDRVSNCPLCPQSLLTLKEYARHVGRHQRELSLFALPHLDGDSDSEEDERNAEPGWNENQGNLTDSDLSDAVSIDGAHSLQSKLCQKFTLTFYLEKGNRP